MDRGITLAETVSYQFYVLHNQVLLFFKNKVLPTSEQFHKEQKPPWQPVVGMSCERLITMPHPDGERQ